MDGKTGGANRRKGSQAVSNERRTMYITGLQQTNRHRIDIHAKKAMIRIQEEVFEHIKGIWIQHQQWRWTLSSLSKCNNITQLDKIGPCTDMRIQIK